MDRLPASPEQLLQWAAGVGRGGRKGANDEREGCVLQKVVEAPHLLDLQALAELRESCDGPDETDSDSDAVERARDMKSPSRQGRLSQLTSGLFKYNLRIWVLVSLGSPAGAWLYKGGYVSLASHPFSPEPDPLSHITNLRQGDSAPFQRRWSVDAFAACLRRQLRLDAFSEQILPQVRAIVRDMFRGLGAAPSGLATKESTRLRRFGLDILVDADLTAWLIEANILKDGYAVGYAPKGAAGEDKRRLVRQLQEAEIQLRKAVRAGAGVVEDAFEQLLPTDMH